MRMNVAIATEIKRRLSGPGRKVVYVCGLPGSGKTTFCTNYSKSAGVSGPVLHSDWFAKYATSERRARIQTALESRDLIRIEAEENPYNWYDWAGFFGGVKKLRETGHLSIEDGWDQATGEKGLQINLSAGDQDVIWCDGIYLLEPKARRDADLIILLESDTDMALQRTAGRDSHRNDAEYLAYKERLTQTYEIPYFAKFRHNADIIIDNSDVERPRLARLSR